MPDQNYITVAIDGLLSKVGELKNSGYTLSQISVTLLKDDTFDLLYSFEKEYALTNLRLPIEKTDEIESVSGLYAYAYLYENEMKDLFGVKINHLNLDFKGNLYKTTVKTPFNPEKPEGGA